MFDIMCIAFGLAILVKIASLTIGGLVLRSKDPLVAARKTYIRSIQAAAECARVECPGINLGAADLEGSIKRMQKLHSEDLLKQESRNVTSVINSLTRRYRQAKREEEAEA